MKPCDKCPVKGGDCTCEEWETYSQGVKDTLKSLLKALDVKTDIRSWAEYRLEKGV